MPARFFKTYSRFSTFQKNGLETKTDAGKASPLREGDRSGVGSRRPSREHTTRLRWWGFPYGRTDGTRDDHHPILSDSAKPTMRKSGEVETPTTATATLISPRTSVKFASLRSPSRSGEAFEVARSGQSCKTDDT